MGLFSSEQKTQRDWSTKFITDVRCEITASVQGLPALEAGLPAHDARLQEAELRADGDNDRRRRHAAAAGAGRPEQKVAAALRDGELRSYSTADGTARSSKQQLFTAAPGATERCACAPCAGLNPESLMKLQLATAGDVAVPPQIGRGRSSFGPSVVDASPPMKSKMKKIATAVVSGAAALQSTDIDGTVALAALGRLEIATKELRSVKRTASGEPEAAAAAERVKM